MMGNNPTVVVVREIRNRAHAMGRRRSEGAEEAGAAGAGARCHVHGRCEWTRKKTVREPWLGAALTDGGAIAEGKGVAARPLGGQKRPRGRRTLAEGDSRAAGSKLARLPASLLRR